MLRRIHELQFSPESVSATCRKTGNPKRPVSSVELSKLRDAVLCELDKQTIVLDLAGVEAICKTFFQVEYRKISDPVLALSSRCRDGVPKPKNFRVAKAEKRSESQWRA
jgi:hypothetical protein